MSTTYIRYPTASGGGVPTYASFAALPATANDGTVAITVDTDTLYAYNANTLTWVAIAGPGTVLGIGTIDSQTASLNGAVIASNALVMQSASATRPGLVNNTTQSFSGNKTFTGTIAASNLSGTNTGDVTLGTANGLSLAGQVLSLQAADSTHTGALTSTDWNTFNNKQATITIGALDAQAANANGLALVSNVLSTQSADATHPGMINNTAQTLSGSKTFSSILNANGGIDVSAAGTLTIGATNATTINIGNSGATVNIQGTTIYENTPQLLVADPLITVNSGGGAGSGQNSGIQIEENLIITGYAETSSDRNSWILKAPNTAGIATITPGSGGITLDQSSHNPVTLGTANGLSLSTQVLSLQAADSTHTGALTSTDWNTFNGKQAAGNYITALTSDVTASGPGSVAATIAANAVTDAKFRQSAGLSLVGRSANTTGNVADITAASDNQVMRRSGTSIGFGSIDISQSNTVGSSLLAIGNGGTGAATKAAAFDALSPMTTLGDVIYGGASGTGTRLGIGSDSQVLTVVGGIPAWATAAAAVSDVMELKNLGLSVTVGSNILTCAIKQADGSTDPSTGTAAVKISMRSNTATSGAYNERSITAALSQTLTVGTTLGSANGVAQNLWVYSIDSDGAGTMKIGMAQVMLDDTQLQTSVAESFTATISNASPGVVTATAHGLNNADAIRFTTTGTLPTGLTTGTTYWVVGSAANSFNVAATPGGTAINTSSAGSGVHTVHIAGFRLVSDAVYTNKPIKLLGYFNISEATAGTWASPPTTVSVGLPNVPESVQAFYTGAPPTGTLTTSDNIVTLGTKVTDTHSAYFTNIYVVPITGVYSIVVSFDISATYAVTNNSQAIIYVDGAKKLYNVAAAGGAQTELWPIVSITGIRLTAGQRVSAYSRSSGTSPSFAADATSNYFSITRTGP